MDYKIFIDTIHDLDLQKIGKLLEKGYDVNYGNGYALRKICYEFYKSHSEINNLNYFYSNHKSDSLLIYDYFPQDHDCYDCTYTKKQHNLLKQRDIIIFLIKKNCDVNINNYYALRMLIKIMLSFNFFGENIFDVIIAILLKCKSYDIMFDYITFKNKKIMIAELIIKLFHRWYLCCGGYDDHGHIINEDLNNDIIAKFGNTKIINIIKTLICDKRIILNKCVSLITISYLFKDEEVIHLFEKFQFNLKNQSKDIFFGGYDDNHEILYYYAAKNNLQMFEYFIDMFSQNEIMEIFEYFCFECDKRVDFFKILYEKSFIYNDKIIKTINHYFFEQIFGNSCFSKTDEEKILKFTEEFDNSDIIKEYMKKCF